MQICPEDKCTGCYACVAVCPHKCITMQENVYGELHPVIDDKVCVECGACQKTCPNNQEIGFNYPNACYASWITDKEKRSICASGGIGTILAEFVVRYKKGVVFGTAYDDELTPRVSYAETLEGIERFKGSKYVQSIVGEDTYKDVRSFLKDGRFVLFIGTPCQIAGLKTYLKRDYDNLLTVDLICHGVSPTKYFKEEISYLVNKHKISGLCDIRFRGNDDNNFCLSLWDSFKKKSNNYVMTFWHIVGGVKMRCYRGPLYKDYYLTGFLLGITLRENCYSCRYARPERVSDITIGDFIGLGKHIPFPYPKKNVSSVTVNTEKGSQFYQELAEKIPELMSIERQYSERLAYKPSLLEPFQKHPLTDRFKKVYGERGYIYASRSVMTREMRKHRIEKMKRKARKLFLLPISIIKKIMKK